MGDGKVASGTYLQLSPCLHIKMSRTNMLSRLYEVTKMSANLFSRKVQKSVTQQMNIEVSDLRKPLLTLRIGGCCLSCLHICPELE